MCATVLRLRSSKSTRHSAQEVDNQDVDKKTALRVRGGQSEYLIFCYACAVSTIISLSNISSAMECPHRL